MSGDSIKRLGPGVFRDASPQNLVFWDLRLLTPRKWTEYFGNRPFSTINLIATQTWRDWARGGPMMGSFGVALAEADDETPARIPVNVKQLRFGKG